MADEKWFVRGVEQQVAEHIAAHAKAHNMAVGHLVADALRQHLRRLQSELIDPGRVMDILWRLDQLELPTDAKLQELAQREETLVLRDAGLSDERIGRKLHRSESTIRRWLREARLEQPRAASHQPGE